MERLTSGTGSRFAPARRVFAIWLPLSVSAACYLLAWGRVEGPRTHEIQWSGLVAGLLWLGASRMASAVAWHRCFKARHAAVHPGVSWRTALMADDLYRGVPGFSGRDQSFAAWYAHRYGLGFGRVGRAMEDFRRRRTMGWALLVVVAWVMVPPVAWVVEGASPVPHLYWAIGLVLGLILLVRSFPTPMVRVGQKHSPDEWGEGQGCLFLAVVMECLALHGCLMATGGIPGGVGGLFWLPGVAWLGWLPSLGGLGIRELAWIHFFPETTFGPLMGFTLLGAFQAAVSLSGRWLWAREKTAPERADLGGPQGVITVVIPVLNEAVTLPGTVEGLRKVPEIGEIIVADGGSRDGSRTVARELGCRVIHAPLGRGRQLRRGCLQARSAVVLLLHADTRLQPDAGEALLRVMRDPWTVGGGFWKTFDQAHWTMKGSQWRCGWRLFVHGRVAADQGFFVRREILEKVGGVPDVPLMEEFMLSERMTGEGRLALAPSLVQTSARRFQVSGPVRTYVRMAWVTCLYSMGVSPEFLAKLYRK